MNSAMGTLRHGSPAHRYFSGIPVWLSVLLTGLWHCIPAHKCSRAIPAWQTGTEPMPNRSINGAMDTLRHDDLAHKYLSGILAWQSVLLTGLWHGIPAHRHFRAIPA